MLNPFRKNPFQENSDNALTSFLENELKPELDTAALLMSIPEDERTEFEHSLIGFLTTKYSGKGPSYVYEMASNRLRKLYEYQIEELKRILYPN